jgi:hypothetical protein
MDKKVMKNMAFAVMVLWAIGSFLVNWGMRTAGFSFFASPKPSVTGQDEKQPLQNQASRDGYDEGVLWMWFSSHAADDNQSIRELLLSAWSVKANSRRRSDGALENFTTTLLCDQNVMDVLQPYKIVTDILIDKFVVFDVEQYLDEHFAAARDADDGNELKKEKWLKRL